MVGFGNLLAQPCSLSLHFASQDVLVYPAPHEDTPGADAVQQPPPPGPDTTLSGVVEVFSPTDRTISAIKIVLRNTQTIAIPDTSSTSSQPTIRYEDACTFSRTIEINAETYSKTAASQKHAPAGPVLPSAQLAGARPRTASLASASLAAAAAAAAAATSTDPTQDPVAVESTSGIFLPRGPSYFTFTFILPATLAPTQRGKHGRLRYACTAIAIGGGRARSNVISPAREIFVTALPQPDTFANSAQARTALINQAEGFNAPGMPAPVALDVQFHDFHDALGILSVSLTSLSLTVGSIATLSIYHPSPPPLLNVHLIRVTLEQTAEVYNRLRKGWMRFPVEKYRLWEAGYMPFKKAEDQPLRPRQLGTVTAAMASHTPSDSGMTRTWPVEAGPLRRAAEWQDSIWVASKQGGKGHPGNAILDRLYLNPADAAAAAAASAAHHPIRSDTDSEAASSAHRRPDNSASGYFQSRPPSPVNSAGGKTRSVPTTPGATTSSHGHGSSTRASTPGVTGKSSQPTAFDHQPHPNPLLATACDSPNHPFLSAISGAWVDKPINPSNLSLSASPASTSSDPDGPNSYRLRALLRLPSDDILHPTSLRGTRSEIHHTHEAVIEVYFSRNNVLSEEKGKEGRPKIQVFSMRKNVVIQSCIVTPDMIHLPPYVAPERGEDPHQGEVGAMGLPTYSDAINTPSPRPASPPSQAETERALARASSPAPGASAVPPGVGSLGATEADPAAPAGHLLASQPKRGRPGLFRRASSSSNGGGGTGGPAPSGSSTSAHLQSQQQPQPAPSTHSHLRSTLSAILHPHSASHHPPRLSGSQPAGAHGGQGSLITAAAGTSGAAHTIASALNLGKRSAQNAAQPAGVHMSTATAPPSRAPSRAASRESSPTRAGFAGGASGGSSGRATPPALVGGGGGGGGSADVLDASASSSGRASPSPVGSAAGMAAQNPPHHHHHHHHYRRNEFAFGFTPSSARRGEGEDSGAHAGQQQHHHHHHRAPSPAHERHAHFIPSQVEGRERARGRTSSTASVPPGGASAHSSGATSPHFHYHHHPNNNNNSHNAYSPSGAAHGAAGPMGTSSGGSGGAGVGTSSSGSTSSSGKLSRRASGQLGGALEHPAGAAHGATAMQVGSSGSGGGGGGGAPTPARLANALRKLQLSQAQAQAQAAFGGSGGSGAGDIPAAIGGSLVTSAGAASSGYAAAASLSAPGSGATTPGGTLVTSGPNMPPEWNLVMAPGERTSTTHSTCMCGRTTESLLRAERLLLIGAPTAPYFTPSPGLNATERPSLAGSLRSSSLGSAHLSLSQGGLDHRDQQQSHAPPAMQRAASYHGNEARLSTPDGGTPVVGSGSGSGRGSGSGGGGGGGGGLALMAGSPLLPGCGGNVGADDPEGVLWSAGMGPDGRPRPPGGMGASSWSAGSAGAAGAASMRRSRSAIDAHSGSGAGAGADMSGPAAFPSASSSSSSSSAAAAAAAVAMMPSPILPPTASALSRAAKDGEHGLGADPAPALAGGEVTADDDAPPDAQEGEDPTGARSGGGEGDHGHGTAPLPLPSPLPARAPTLEDLMPTDEFVLARGRDPDEIMRRKAELSLLSGAQI